MSCKLQQQQKGALLWMMPILNFDLMHVGHIFYPDYCNFNIRKPILNNKLDLNFMCFVILPF